MNPLTETLGIVAGTLTTLSFIPQVRQVWTTRSTKDISLAMYAAFSFGVLLWVVYGALIGSVAVTLANGATLVLALVILYFKLRHG